MVRCSLNRNLLNDYYIHNCHDSNTLCYTIIIIYLMCLNNLHIKPTIAIRLSVCLIL